MTTRSHPLLSLFIAAALLFGLLTVTLAPFASQASAPDARARNVSPQPTGWTDPGLGPALLLVTLPGDRIPGALPPTVTVHALLDGQRDLYIASGGLGDAAAARTAGLVVTVLDSETQGRVYYLADGETPGVREVAASAGEVLLDVGHTLLVATPAAQERTLVESLTDQGVRISALTSSPLALGGDERVAVANIGRINEADPFIAGLLDQLNTDDLAAIIAELSGETPVVIDGQAVTLATRYTFTQGDDQAARYIYQRYVEMGVDVDYFDWYYGRYSGRNVIAQIPGVLHPERVWFIGGHFDTNSNDPYNLAPGADDNGTGSASVLLIADILSQMQVADTVRFVHFSGEEQGQWGSKVYVPTLASTDEEVMGYINLDMFGWDGDGDRVVEVHTGTGEASNALGTVLIDANQVYTQGLSFERKAESANRFSDHSAFWDGGYPAVLAIENFFDDAIPRDRSPWYHNTGDTLERVDLDYTLRYARTALAAIAELAGAAEQIDAPTPTPTPLPPTPTPTATPPPDDCVNLLANGGWEAGGGWRYGSTPYPARVVDEPVHGGASALQVGIPAPAANRVAHSSAFQEVSIPADAELVQLRYWQRPGGVGDGQDYRETRLLTASYGNLALIDRDAGDGDGRWTERVFDLSDYRGRTVVLYFNVYNDGGGSQLWNYLDDVALLACSGAAPTDTPTPVPTVTMTPTSTITPTATVTPTITPTPTPLPAEAIVSTTSLAMDLLTDGSWGEIGFNDPGVGHPVTWTATSEARWLLLPNSSGDTDGSLRFRVNRFDLTPLVAATVLTDTASVSDTSSISITFPEIGDAVSIGITVTDSTLNRIYLPSIMGEGITR